MNLIPFGKIQIPLVMDRRSEKCFLLSRTQVKILELAISRR